MDTNDNPHVPPCRWTRRSLFRSVSSGIWVLLLAGPGAPLAVAESASAPQSAVVFPAAALRDLQEVFQEYQPELPAPQRLGMQEIVAYEEHPLFVYAEGRVASVADGTTARRRLLFFKPSVFVLEERIVGLRALPEACWWDLAAERIGPEEDGLRQVQVPGGWLLWHPLPPEFSSTESEGPSYRQVHVFLIPPADAVLGEREAPMLGVSVRASGEFVISAGQQQWEVRLPQEAEAAGSLAVWDAEGTAQLERRLLPSGILPHGPEGVPLLDRWDSAYRRGRAGWDPGRPASDLREAVESDALPVGRALELGCGSGINAIYLAQHGFEVTALDVAPTALRQAEQLAKEAGVDIRWVLADASAPPEMEPFDFIFDRGCYHHVRHQDAAGYVSGLRRLTRPGGKVMILAANANEPHRGGPPRIHEHELRADFSRDFTFEWLKETRFDSVSADRATSLAWNLLLVRKEDPPPEPAP